MYIYIYSFRCILYRHVYSVHCSYIYIYIVKSLRLRPPTPEAYGKTADFGTLCIPGSSQRLDPSAAFLSSSDRSRLAALNVMLTLQGFQGGVQRGSRGSRGSATSRKHEKLDKRSGAVCQAYYAASRIVCRRFQQDKWLKVTPLSARRGLPRWLQPASSTSPWLFYQVLSEVFSKSSSVMSSLLLL